MLHSQLSHFGAPRGILIFKQQFAILRHAFVKSEIACTVNLAPLAICASRSDSNFPAQQSLEKVGHVETIASLPIKRGEQRLDISPCMRGELQETHVLAADLV